MCPTLVQAFLIERSEAVVARAKSILDIKQFSEPKHLAKLQHAVDKEWNTWSKYNAVTIVPPKIAETIDPKLILDSY